MATTHADITVFCLVPIPNGRNVPIFVYVIDGFIQWNDPNNTINTKMAHNGLYMRITLVIIILY